MKLQTIEAKRISGWALQVTRDGRTHDNLCGTQAEADGLARYLGKLGVIPTVRRIDLIRSVIKTDDSTVGTFVHLAPAI